MPLVGIFCCENRPKSGGLQKAAKYGIIMDTIGVIRAYARKGGNVNPFDMGVLAKKAMLAALDTTPNPGLVDRETAGPHTDMDYSTMQKAIEAVAPHMVTFGQTGLFLADKTDEQVSHVMQEVGRAALADMYQATGGVNALKGTVLALGLYITAYYRLYRKGVEIDSTSLSAQISALAQGIERERDSHGAWVAESYQVEGALGEARCGYARWLTEGLWLYRKLEGEHRRLRLLLYIMSQLKDSCAYYRAGAELAENARTIAKYLYEHFDIEDVRTADRYFERCHLSMGGSGDMLALVLLADLTLQRE